MAITSSAGDGIRVTSAAKESAGNAAVLGSPATDAANTVIVPDAISVNNEGNLEGGASYVGRLFILRPWEMKLVSVEIEDGGQNYAVDDVLTLAGGTAGPGGAPQVTVTAVTGSPAVITAVSISREASWAIRREANTGAPSPPNQFAASPQGTSVTGGTGTGARFICRYAPHFEVRIITADNANTLTVGEDWEVPPESGDNWAVAYIPEDMATVNGLTLRSQSGVFEATRLISIGVTTVTARHACFAVTGGKAIELDNSLGAFTVTDSGVWLVGYLQDGVPVDGAYFSTSGTTGTDISLHGADSEGSMFFVRDFQMRSPRESLSWADAVLATSPDRTAFRKDVGCIIQEAKLFDVDLFFADEHRARDLVVQAPSDSTQFDVLLSTTGDGDTADINRATMVNLVGSGFVTTGAAATVEQFFGWLRNIRFIAPQNMVEVDDFEVWQFVNPVWQPVLTDLAHFSFVGTASPVSDRGRIEEWMSLIVRPADVSGIAIAAIVGYVYEGARDDQLLTDDTARSLSAAYDPIADSRFEDEILTGAVVYVTDLINNVYTPSPIVQSPSQVVFDPRGEFAFRGYLYGFQPLLVPFTVELDGGRDLAPTMLVDDALTAATAAAALSLSPNPIVTRHHPDVTIQSPQLFTDTARMLALNYKSGNGNVPLVGQTVAGVVGSPLPTGVIADHIGDGVTGTLLLESWNEVDWADEDAIGTTGVSPTFQAVADRLGQSPEFYETYTWLIDAQGYSVEALYDYLAARMAEDPVTDVFERVIVWGGTDTDAAQLLKSGATGFFTPRSDRLRDGELLANPVTQFTDDFNRANGALTAESPLLWENASSGNGSRILTNQVAPDTLNVFDEFMHVAAAGVTFGDDQWAQCTVAVSPLVSPATGESIDLILRGDSTRSAWKVRFIGSQLFNQFAISTIEYTGGGGVSRTDVAQVSGSTVVAAGDVLTAVAYGQSIIGFVNGVEVIRYTDSGQEPFAPSGVPGFGFEIAGLHSRIDDFAAGDFDASNALGEGVWVTNRGSGTYAFFTSDAGQVFNVPATVTLTVTVIDRTLSPQPLQGVRVRIQEPTNTEPNDLLVAQGTTNASGVFTTSFDYTADTPVEIVARLSSLFSPLRKRYIDETVPAVITAAGLNVTINLREDPNADFEN